MSLNKEFLDDILGPSSSHQSLAKQLQELADIFLEKGSVRGVTALKNPSAILEEFILDSLAGAEVLQAQEKVIDIGTGGGVPGLVLALARPDIDFVLTDSASKKTRWVSELVAHFELQNVEVVTERLEKLGRQVEFREKFEVVTAKALASLNVLLEFSLPLLATGGRLLAYKGPALIQEIEEARFALEELGGKVHRCCRYSIGEKQFYLCEIQKIQAISERYPRRDGVPQKKPLSNSRKN